MDAALDPVFRFNTQFTDRERQCLEAGDGSFEVRDAACAQLTSVFAEGGRPIRSCGNA